MKSLANFFTGIVAFLCTVSVCFAYTANDTKNMIFMGFLALASLIIYQTEKGK
jgi:uncharacterized PurR-regulated membrane protein YhhQ (DUF165 family)